MAKYEHVLITELKLSNVQTSTQHTAFVKKKSVTHIKYFNYSLKSQVPDIFVFQIVIKSTTYYIT